MAEIEQTDPNSAGTRLFSNFFGQKQSSAVEEPPASVLAEWNKYAEGAAGPSQSDRLIQQMEEGSASFQRLFNSSVSRVSSGVQGMSGSVNAQMSSFQMPSSTQLGYFAAFLGSGIVFLVLAFSLFLPVIIVAPSKFAICFTIGSVLVLSAFISLRGWRHQLSHMLSKDRLLFTFAYLGSMGGTLYAAMSMHSYVLSLVCCSVQVVALLYYTLSYFPGGTYGLKYILYTAQSSIMQCFMALVKSR